MIDSEGPLGPWYGHTGGGPGSRCAVYRYPDRACTVATFSDLGDVERRALELAAA
jgi:hypothetical protein